MSPLAADLIGFSGSFCIVAAYAYNSATDRVDPFLYNGINLAGALLLGLSLTVNYNLPSLVLEIVWTIVAVYGLTRAWRRRRA